jgi:hypothetical protein
LAKALAVLGALSLLALAVADQAAQMEAALMPD